MPTCLVLFIKEKTRQKSKCYHPTCPLDGENNFKKTMAKLCMAHASTNGAHKPPGPKGINLIKFVQSNQLDRLINLMSFFNLMSLIDLISLKICQALFKDSNSNGYCNKNLYNQKIK